MNYAEAIEYIESLVPTQELPGLERIEAFLAANGSPQTKLKVLHIGGTNGKGSTAAMLDSILQAGGVKTAKFTGPHLLKWNERFHLNGTAISDFEFAQRATTIRELSDKFAEENSQLGPLTWFEFLTALAIFYFVECPIDVAIFEVGLGGRFDATNVFARPLSTAITNVSLDHTHVLGNTIEQIAAEKAGIIKAKVPIVTAASPPALEVIKARAAELSAPFIPCSVDTSGGTGLHRPDSYTTSEDGIMKVISLTKKALLGSHQRANAVVAIEMLKSSGLMGLSSDVVEKGLANVYWPGRFQVIPTMGVVLDGAHNVAGGEALRASLDELFPKQAFRFVFACYENKDGVAMLQTLLRSKDRLYASEVAGKRAVFPKTVLARHAEEMGVQISLHPSVGQALMQAFKERKGDEIIVVTGSFGTIRDALQQLGWMSVEEGLVKSGS
jgi:dihydrofolate synthase/folylpolyglutamate synthase